MRGLTIASLCGLAILGLLTACAGQARQQANSYEREQELRATGNGVSSFRTPEQPEELWRVEVDGFRENPEDRYLALPYLRLCLNGALGMELTVMNLTSEHASHHDCYLAVIDNKQIVFEGFPPENAEYSGTSVASIVPSEQPFILTTLLFGYPVNVSGKERFDSPVYFELAGYDLKLQQTWKHSFLVPSDTQQGELFVPDLKPALFIRDRLYSTGVYSTDMKYAYLCIGSDGNLLWHYEFPEIETYWGGYDSFMVFHQTQNSTGTSYITGDSIILAINREGIRVAEYTNDMQYRGEPIVGLDGNVYQVVQDIPSKASVLNVKASENGEDLYQLRWQQDVYILVLNDQLVKERKVMITEGWPLIDCVDAAGSYTIFLGHNSKRQELESKAQTPFLGIVRYDAMDLEQWRYPLKNTAAMAPEAMLDPDGKLLFIDDGALICLSTDGTKLWEYRADRALGSFLPGGDGYVYCTADNDDEEQLNQRKQGVEAVDALSTSGVIVYAIGDPGTAS